MFYLKEMFGENIRVIVPQISMSAGTMIATSAKSIVMGKHSDLGPVDPQINGIPAFAIKAQFQKAYDEIKTDPRCAPIWAPMLAQLGVSFVQQCDWAIEYAKDFVIRALASNMQDDPDVLTAAPRIADELSDLTKNKSHERRFHYSDCKALGLKIEMLEDSQEFQEIVLTIHHCYMHAVTNTSVIKVIENLLGNALIKQGAPLPSVGPGGPPL